MGLTKSDINRIIYRTNRAKGLSHEETISLVPKSKRDEFKGDIDKTFIESHFGMKDKSFYISLCVVVIIFSVIAFSL